MSNIRAVIKKGLIGLAVLLLSGLAPTATLFADPSCTPPPSGPGVHWPTGSDAATYIYQCAPSPYAGEWTNAHYVYDPSNGATSPLYAPDYSYDCASGKWTMVQWDYSPADGQFYSSRVATAAPSGVSTGCPVAAAPTVAGGGGASGTGSNDTSGALATGSGISNTGPNSNNTSNLTGNNTLNANNLSNAAVTNNLTGIAGSGDALVSSNMLGGSAATGNAQDMANIINMLQSSSNVLGTGSNVITFTDNINGDVNGDLLLNPAALGSTIQNSGPSSNNTGNTNLNNNLTINNASNGTINNNINLAANSGNATVDSNTTGGNATTGNAQAIANVVNMINSALTAGKSFIGTININGNLNGDILLPPNFIDQLIADNVPTVNITGPSSDNTANTTTTNNTNITNTNNLGINNTVNAGATSGTAAVTDNTTAGNATSGAANTHITAFNLTGSKVIGANDILVFVNVTGKWVGLIVNAPPGTTAAELGGGITTSGPNSSNTTNTNVTNNATLNNTANQQINNHITTAAQSGNATVSDNTHGGSAASGNADSAVNLLNVENSTLDLSNWFGILFINVFGTWNGSFGINTSAGDTVSPTSAGAAQASGFGSAVGPVFSFVPRADGSTGIKPVVKSSLLYSTASSVFGQGSGTASNTGSGAGTVIAAKTIRTNNHAGTPVTTTPSHINWIIIVGSSLAFGGAYLFIERLITLRHTRKI